jgi:hypothetical protein
MAPGSHPDDARDATERHLRRQARLNVLVWVGFWMTATSVVVMLPACVGCGVFLPASVAPWIFLPVPLTFVVGAVLLVTSQVLANRSPVCLVLRFLDRRRRCAE